MRSLKFRVNMWKPILSIICTIFFIQFVSAQSVTGPEGYKVVNLGSNNSGGSYTVSDTSSRDLPQPTLRV